ncbi:hypothetical protein LOM8899_03730 [Flavimaricola marinus]|uniref:Uncharacterized protein n=1 Tax=Flavimaricola marinus TaxID=1819565 RepID=A0A238LJ41_9RHOB|nr:hypothetical protein LOM8899_03730 [Flavimaricola marinus]
MTCENMLSPKKGRAQDDTIDSADKFAVLPDFDRVSMAQPKQLPVEIGDHVVDPGLVTIGTTADHRIKGAVERDLHVLFAHSAAEASAYPISADGEDAALLRVDPENLRVEPAFRHWKYAGRVGI